MLFQSTPSGGKATYDVRERMVRLEVSIHAFRGEGDSPVRRSRPVPRSVSIHAFRGEGDRRAATARTSGICFNPRLPGGRRLWVAPVTAIPQPFQSTPSGGTATSGGCDASTTDRFQSTPSGGKATISVRRHNTSYKCFNPRLPGGRRQIAWFVERRRRCFNPRLPGGRRPGRRLSGCGAGGVSIHAFRGEGDRNI